MNKLTICAVLILALPTALLAADEIIHSNGFPKGDAEWTVTSKKIHSDADAAGSVNPKQIARIDVVRKGKLRRDSIVWNDGGRTEYWWSLDPLVVVFDGGRDGSIRAMKPGLMGDRRFDESLFSWASAGTYVGQKNLLGKTCLFYETKVETIDGEPEPRQIWLEKETRLPVAWSDGIYLMVFSFAPMPSTIGPLVVPQKYLAELQRYAAYVAPPKRATR